MKILHITPRYYPARGGAEYLLAEMSSRLVEMGHEVTVVTSDALDIELFWQRGFRRISEPYERIDGVEVYRFTIRHLPFVRYAFALIRRLLWMGSSVPSLPTQWYSWLAEFTPWIPDLWQWAEKPGRDFDPESFDLVSVMGIGFEPFFQAAARFARTQNIPYFVIPLTHLGAGPQPGEDELGRFYTMRHQIELVTQADGVIAQTASERNFYIGKGVSPDAIWSTGPGISPHEFMEGGQLVGDGGRFKTRYNITGPLVISISQMSYDKGTIHTVEAVRMLWEAGVEVELALAGSILQQFQDYFDQLPQSDRDRIHLLGFVSAEERHDLLAAADMLVMPSRSDSFGIVYLEAWLHGVPVIGANTWGVNDVITDRKDGFLVPFGDLDAIGDRIKRLAENRALAREMGEHGRANVLENHTWDKKMASIETIYSRLVAENKRAKEER